MATQLPARLPGETDTAYQQRLIRAQLMNANPFGQIGSLLLNGETPSGVSLTAPQAGDEWDVTRALRQGVGGVRQRFIDAWNAPGQAVQDAGAAAVDTPNTRAAATAETRRTQPPRNAQPAGERPWWVTAMSGAQEQQRRVNPNGLRGGFQEIYQGWIAPIEGGYAARDGSSGAPVNFGINQRANPDINVRDLTPARARDIMLQRYWIPSGAANIRDPRLQAIHMDTAVNMGVGAANRMLEASGNDPTRYLALRESRYRSIGGSDLPVWLERNQRLAQYTGIASSSGPAAALGAPPPGMAAYDARMGAALGQVDNAEAAALRRQDLSFPITPAPTLPAPQHFQPPDFSAGNAAFEKARPVNPFDEAGSENRLMREHFFGGMAQALLNIRPGQPVGFGEMLMRAGAGALGGRMEGAAAVRARMDRYDGMMQNYNQALASRSDSQTAAATNTINQNLQMDNEHAARQADINIRRWQNENRTELVGNNVIAYRQGANNTQEVHIVPVEGMVRAEAARTRAQIMLGSAGPAQQNAQWAAQMAQNQVALMASIAVQQGGQTGADAVGNRLAATVVPMVDSGQIGNVVGDAGMEHLRQQAYGQLGINQQMMANDPAYARQQQPRINDYIAQRVVRDAILNPALAQQLLSIQIGTASRAVERVRTQRETTRRSVSPTGRVSSSTSTSYETAD